MNLSLIALKVTKHSDKQSILTALSRERGRVSLALPAGSGKSSARMKALTMPLCVIECVTDSRSEREIIPMRQVHQLIPLRTIHSNPVKQMVAMFLAEVLNALLRETNEDESLFDFITRCIRILDEADGTGTANFHICFLYQLGRLSGIEPDTSTFTPGSILDIRDGIWRQTMPLHREYLTPEESAAAYRLSRMTFSNYYKYRYTREERNRILNALLHYLSVHFVSLRNIHSLEILRAML
ncbi:MAG: DNA repair protein RecO [Duncaniella sp.]|nr:DNA repair protein RecO [Duncaniella sp.]